MLQFKQLIHCTLLYKTQLLQKTTDDWRCVSEELVIIYLSGEQFISYLLSCDWLKRDRYSLSPIQTCLTFHFVALASLKQSQLLFDRFSTLYILDSVYYVQYNYAQLCLLCNIVIMLSASILTFKLKAR